MARGEFGERLKREREMREVSKDELTKATRISTRFIEALENEDWEKLPGGVFGRGFVRSIARYLGLDEQALLGEYDLARAEKEQAVSPKPEERIPAPPKWVPVAAIVAILLVLVGLFYAGRYGWRQYTAHRGAKQTSDSLPSAPPSAGISAVTPVAVDSSFPATSSSAIPFLDLFVSTSALSANEQFEVTAGDSSAVLLELNG
jgi:cytoskeleton protein RodZ